MKMAHHYGRGLEVKMERGALVIRIGAQTLAHAVTYAEWANQWDATRQEYVRTFAITDAPAFAEEVAHIMMKEREDGSSPLSDFLDAMTEAAVDDGSMACVYDQRITDQQTEYVRAERAEAQLASLSAALQLLEQQMRSHVQG